MLVTAALLACGCVSAPVREVPVARFDDAPFLALVKKYAPTGRVDYAAWKAHRADAAALQDFVNVVASAGPKNRPELFPTPESRLAYWCTAYNAWVVQLVLERFPLRSVMDVKVGPLGHLKAGAGFFYELGITVGGERTNLYNLEHRVLRKLGEPRIHFAINCASNSCPTLRALHWTSADLDEATRAFVNDPRHVRVTDTAVELNPILDWFAEDFGDVRAFLLRHADADLAARLRASPTLKLQFFDYDWGLNSTP